MVNVNSGKCLEIPGGSTADGATADQWTCEGGTHQLWRKRAAIGGYVTSTNVNSGLCLQVAGASTSTMEQPSVSRAATAA
ncbi:RICIN domain-containing protein [Streptomyces sp. NPDC058307]|uniref:RICIN domain-containing protein n=1 Tax=Streptomyces sp. NPDC058307 TaxID=3346439 RepID=UPI0036F0A700